MKKKKLNWGQTPWDALSREELLREVWKMFSALQSANSALLQIRDSLFWNRAGLSESDTSEQIRKKIENAAAGDLYWGKGTAGSAISKIEQALCRTEKYSSEDIYRSFFRYADDLLFKRNGLRIGFGWAVCPKCGTMVGETLDGESAVGKTCDWKVGKCGGILRPLEWSDLSPEKARG